MSQFQEILTFSSVAYIYRNGWGVKFSSMF